MTNKLNALLWLQYELVCGVSYAGNRPLRCNGIYFKNIIEMSVLWIFYILSIVMSKNLWMPLNILSLSSGSEAGVNHRAAETKNKKIL